MQSTAKNLQVIYEDNHLIVINKRPSDIVQGDKTGDIPLSEIVKEYIKQKYQKPGDVFLGTVHRLDRPVSGIVLYARTSKALSRMNEIFKSREIKKIYWACVKNAPENQHGSLQHYLKKNESKNKSFPSTLPVAGGKMAELDYKVIAHSDNFHLLEVNPKTGRHHQIRVQLAAMGCAIKGDLKYGFPRSNKDASIHLHARALEFTHPVKKERIKVIANPPDDPVWNAFVSLLK